MPRHNRFIPEGGALVEVTDRTIQARFLLVPPPEEVPTRTAVAIAKVSAAGDLILLQQRFPSVIA